MEILIKAAIDAVDLTAGKSYKITREGAYWLEVINDKNQKCKYSKLDFDGGRDLIDKNHVGEHRDNPMSSWTNGI